MCRRVILWFLILRGLASGVLGHQTSDSYLALGLTNGIIQGRWAIAIRDLNHVLEIDTDKDGEISDPELEKGKPAIEKYVYEKLKLSSERSSVSVKHQGYEIQEADTAIYLVLLFESEKRENWPDLVVEYRLFFETDPLHRGLLRLDLPNRTETTVFNPGHPLNRFLLDQAKPQRGNAFQRFLEEGIWHIWRGYDHVLFLVALLLPAVLQRVGRDWKAAPGLRQAFLNVVKIVTAFTLAHSITLTLATLGYVRLPSRLTESAIAVSVFFAAVNNLRAILPERTWTIAFGFGLIHGFGFATVLSELELPRASLGVALFSFNLGVEIGQLAIVLVFVPMAFALRRTGFYRELVRGGSVVIALLALIWLVERVTDWKIL